VGILWDFGKVKELKEELDHQFINEIPPFDKINATAENLAEFIYRRYKDESPHLKFKIRIFETAVGKRTWCQIGDFE
jgi:6-pyruvoyltetrahydropterin/6-carboxytetrahydropterin synthase